MTLKIRRIIYISFFIIFIILSAIAIFYTLGYRYYFKKEKIEKNGGMILELKPKEVKIYINNKFKKKTNFLEDSFKITNLLSGEYSIQVKKDGYYPWEKKVKIEKEKINFVKNIVLFKKQNLPKIILNGKNIETFQIPNKNKILIYQNNDNLSYFKIYDEKTRQIFNVPNLQINNIKNSKLKFSAKGNEILFFKNNKNYVYNFNQQKLINLENKISKNIKIKKIKWDNNKENIIFFLNENNKISQINLFNYKIKEIFSPQKIKINDFYIDKGNIYLITQNSLIKIEKKNSNQKTLLANISSNFKFKYCPEQYLTLIDKTKNNLIILNKEKEKIIIQDKAKNILWSKKLDDNNYLVAYNNNFEIYTSNLKLNEKELIIRHSKPIGQIIWYPDYAHLLFTYNNSINVTEICKNVKKNSNLLFKGNNIKNIIVNNKGDKIYFIENVETQENLFELDI